jgi:outer membrane protein OmpA-like peptidoglycan-associated protein
MKLNIKKPASFLAVLVLGLSPLTSIAQGENLIDNGGFETVEGKLKSLGCIDLAVGWMSPTGVRADIYSPCKIPEINVPENIYGKEDPKEGTNYAGIVGFSFGDAIPRSYLMAKLNMPLKKGMKYCVKFSVSLAEVSKYASNQIGVNFSSKQFGTDSKTAIIEKTHVLDSKNKIFSAMYNWEQVCGVYYAEGGEKFITIGNFTSNENTKNEKIKKDPNMKKAQITAAYYYIDDVVVSLISEDATCDCEIAPEDVAYSTTIYQKVINVNDKMPAKEQIEKQIAYFAFGKNKLTPEAIVSLDLIANLMKANPAIKLDIAGHSDEMEEKVGAEKPVFSDMSNKRINEIMKYLMAKGIQESRLISTPTGSSEPNENITESDDDDLKLAKNRRVTFKVR